MKNKLDIFRSSTEFSSPRYFKLSAVGTLFVLSAVRFLAKHMLFVKLWGKVILPRKNYNKLFIWADPFAARNLGAVQIYEVFILRAACCSNSSGEQTLKKSSKTLNRVWRSGSTKAYSLLAVVQGVFNLPRTWATLQMFPRSHDGIIILVTNSMACHIISLWIIECSSDGNLL